MYVNIKVIAMMNSRKSLYRIPLIIIITFCLLHLLPDEVKANKGFLLNEPLTRTASTAMDGKIYIFGGENETNMTDSIMIFDPETGNIVPAAVTLPFPVTNPTAATDGISTYVFGGETGVLVSVEECAPIRSRDLVIFTPPDGIEHVADLFPYDLEGNAITYDGSYFYLFGNCMCGSKDVRRNVIRFDPKEREYEIYESLLPSNMSGGAAVWYEDAAYIFGGKTDGNRTLDTVLRFVPGKPVEILNAHLPEPVFKAGIALDGDIAYILGGQTEHGPTDAIRLFDMNERTFSKADNSLMEPRATRACVSIGDQIYLVGGDTQEGLFQSIERVAFIRAEPDKEKWSYHRDDILLVVAIAGSTVMVTVVAVIYIRDYVKYRKQKDNEINNGERNNKEE